MGRSRLFTNQTVVMRIVCTLLFATAATFQGAIAFGQATPGSPANSYTISTSPSDPCTDPLNKFDDAYSIFDNACSGTDDKARIKTCIKDAQTCRNKENEMNAALSEDDTSADECNDLYKGCPDLAGTKDEKVKDKKEATKERKELQTDRDKAQKEAQDKQKQSQDEMNKLDDEAMKNDQDWQKQRLELTNKLKKEMADIDDSRAKAVKDAQDNYDKIDVEYIKMRDEIRRLSSATTNQDLTWTVQCRNAANTQAKAEEDKLDKQMAADDVLIQNYQLASSAGKLNRKMKLKRDKIIISFNQYLNRCLKGDVDPGTGIKLALDKSKNELHDSQAKAADQAARLEKLRQQILVSLNQLQQSLDQKKQMAIQDNQQAIAMLDQNHQMNSDRLQQRRMQAGQQAYQSQATQAKAAQNLDSQLKDAKVDEQNSSARALCGSNMSKDKAADMAKRREAVFTQRRKLRSICQNASQCFKNDNQKSTCQLIENAMQDEKRDENSKNSRSSKATQ
jgi:hypothetical protein